MFKKKYYFFLDKLREATNYGFLFKIRFFIFHCLLYLFNFDTVFISWIKQFFHRKKTNTNAMIAVLSMYRPLFWHGNIFETQATKALKKRGKNPVHLLCGSFLDVCDSQYYLSNKTNNPLLCRDCKLRNRLFYSKNDSATLWLDDYYDPEHCKAELKKIDKIETLSEAKNYSYDNLPIGKLAHLSVCRYWLRLSLNEEHLGTYKDFLRAAVKLHQASSKLFESKNFENFLIFNGRYLTFRIPLELIKRKQLPYSTYEFSEQERILFSHSAISVLWDDVEAKFSAWCKQNQVTPLLNAEVKSFISSRRKNFVASFVDISQDIKIDAVDLAVFTNIVWDSGAFERDTIFTDQFSWISSIIDWASLHPALRVAIRIHPAETNVMYNKTSEKMQKYIAGRHTNLPHNVIIIPPEQRASSYALMDKAKVISVYTSSIGLESAIANKCVIAAAKTHYMMPGITLNPNSKEAYFSLLEDAIKKPQLPDLDQVCLYTYWFYKVHHRLNDTHLHKKPFSLIEDSRFLRIPYVDDKLVTKEFNDLIDEF